MTAPIRIEHDLLGDRAVPFFSAFCDVLKARGLTRDSVLAALTAIRGNQRVTSATPEGAYEALAKYGQDLVAAAHDHEMVA